MKRKFRRSFSLRQSKAFTLMEILVVIAILGLLVSVIFMGTSQARAKTRDAKRKAEAGAIHKALILYEADNGFYPVPQEAGWVSLEDDPVMDTGKLFSEEIVSYLPEVPEDPLWGREKEEGVPFSYQYSIGDTEGDEYKLHVEMETGAYASHEVYSGGGGGIGYGEEEPVICLVEGWIDVQGRANDSGVMVVFTETGGAFLDKDNRLSLIPFVVAQSPAGEAITASSGGFSLELPAGTYNVTADKVSFLSSETTVDVSGTITLPILKILGGDSDDNGTVNQADLDIIDANYGQHPFDPRADVNNDGEVGILDSVLAAGNMNKSEPQPWQR